MVDDYTRQLEIRDETIKRMESSQMQSSHNSNYTQQLRQEIEDYKHDNNMLRDKITSLQRDVDHVSSGQGARQKQLKEEVDRLNQVLIEKDRFIEQQEADQKNQWAEIYGT